MWAKLWKYRLLVPPPMAARVRRYEPVYKADIIMDLNRYSPTHSRKWRTARARAASMIV